MRTSSGNLPSRRPSNGPVTRVCRRRSDTSTSSGTDDARGPSERSFAMTHDVLQAAHIPRLERQPDAIDLLIARWVVLQFDPPHARERGARLLILRPTNFDDGRLIGAESDETP